MDDRKQSALSKIFIDIIVPSLYGAAIAWLFVNLEPIL